MERLRLVCCIQSGGGLRGVVPNVLDVAHQVSLQHSLHPICLSVTHTHMCIDEGLCGWHRDSAVALFTFLLFDTALPKKLPMIQ